MGKIGIYLRVSTDEQAISGLGLLAQEEKCREYIRLYDYKEEVVVYLDDGYSAKNMNRPELKKLLNDVKNDVISTIVIYKLDRLTRNVRDTYELIDFLVNKECQLFAVIDKLDITSANGRVLVGILSVLSQWEREIISERTIAAIESKLSLGQYPFGGKFKVFAYDKDENDYLTINEKEAKLLMDGINMYIDGAYFTDICNYFVENGYTSLRNWHSTKKVLTREWNVGRLTYRGKVYNNVFPAIITEDKYMEILGINERRKKTEPELDKYLFRTKISCSNCGTKCVLSSTLKKFGTSKKKYFYYVCPNCHKRVNQDSVLQQCSLALTMHISVKDKKEEVLKVKSKVDEIDKKINMLLESYLENKITHDAYIYSINLMQKKKRSLEIELKRANAVNVKSFMALDYEEKKKTIDSNIRRIDFDFENNCISNIEFM